MGLFGARASTAPEAGRAPDRSGVEWRTSAGLVPYPEALAAMEERVAAIRAGAVPELVWLSLDYSPIVDDDGSVAGVLALVVETTDKVRAQRYQAGVQERLRAMFAQAPGFMAMTAPISAASSPSQ